MDDFEIDYITKSIYIEGDYYTLKDIGEKIKFNIDKGNYKVIAKLSNAMEVLQEALNKIKDVSLAIPGHIYEKYEYLSKKEKIKIDDLMMKAIEFYVKTISVKQEIEVDVDVDIVEEVPKAKPKIEVNMEEIPKAKSEPVIIEEILQKPKMKPQPIANIEIIEEKTVKKIPSKIVDPKTNLTEDDWFNKKPEKEI